MLHSWTGTWQVRWRRDHWMVRDGPQIWCYTPSGPRKAPSWTGLLSSCLLSLTSQVEALLQVPFDQSQFVQPFLKLDPTNNLRIRGLNVTKGNVLSRQKIVLFTLSDRLPCFCETRIVPWFVCSAVSHYNRRWGILFSFCSPLDEPGLTERKRVLPSSNRLLHHFRKNCCRDSRYWFSWGWENHSVDGRNCSKEKHDPPSIHAVFTDCREVLLRRLFFLSPSRYYAKTKGEYLEFVRNQSKRADAILPSLFKYPRILISHLTTELFLVAHTVLPRYLIPKLLPLRVHITIVPVFFVVLSLYQLHLAPNFDCTRPGMVHFNTHILEDRPLYTVLSTALHEVRISASVPSYSRVYQDIICKLHYPWRVLFPITGVTRAGTRLLKDGYATS